MEQLRAQLNGTECTVYVGAGLLGRTGGLLRDALPAVRRWAVAADETVCALYGETVLASLRAAGLAAEVYLLPPGEAAKTPEAWLHLCRAILRERPAYRPHCLREGCGGRLRDEGAVWRCDTCQQSAGDGRLALRQVVARQEPMTVGELVRAFGLSTKTVESWALRGRIEPVDPDARPRRFHPLDVLRLADAGGAASGPR